jgi:hypothetical protein
VIEGAWRDAAGFTVSAGASEIMLHVIATHLWDAQ